MGIEMEKNLKEHTPLSVVEMDVRQTLKMLCEYIYYAYGDIAGRFEEFKNLSFKLYGNYRQPIAFPRLSIDDFKNMEKLLIQDNLTEVKEFVIDEIYLDKNGRSLTIRVWVVFKENSDREDSYFNRYWILKNCERDSFSSSIPSLETAIILRDLIEDLNRILDFYEEHLVKKAKELMKEAITDEVMTTITAKKLEEG